MSVKNGSNWYRFQPPAVVMMIFATLAGIAIAQSSGPTEKPVSKGAPQPPAQPSVFPQGIPKLEQFLSVALERHPDVVVARSKVEAARADLLKAEATAMKELLQLHQRTMAQRSALEVSRKLPGSEASVANSAIAASELGLLEWELALSMGFHSGGKLPGTEASSNTKASPAELAAAQYVDLALPKGELAAKLKDALNSQIDFSLVNAPLPDLCAALSEKTGVSFIMNKDNLENNGFATDAEEFSVEAKEMGVTSILQQIEDQKGVLFIVRDYGILVCGESPLDGVSARDFAKLTDDEIRDKYRAKQAELQRQMQSMGGMMGGGMGGGGGGFF